MKPGNAFPARAIGRNGSDSSGTASSSGTRLRSIVRADLHVHSRYSRLCHPAVAGWSAAVPGDPLAVVAAARSRGMDLVTLTDLDTIDGCLDFLDRRPGTADFFISEETLTIDPPTGARLHVLLYGITEAQHREIRRLREDVRDLAAYARAEGIAACLSPFFGARPGAAWPPGAIRRALVLFDLFEVRNAAFSRAHNEMVARLVQEARRVDCFGVTGGSSAHGPARAGRAATVAFARTRQEFLGELRAGRTWVWGEQGSRFKAAADLYRALRGGDRMLSGGALLLRHGIFHARLSTGIASARRRLDRLEVRSFQDKAKAFAPEETPGKAPSHQSGAAATGPDA